MAKTRRTKQSLAQEPCYGCGKQPDLMGEAWALLFKINNEQTRIPGAPYEIEEEFVVCAHDEKCHIDAKKKIRNPEKENIVRKAFFGEWRDFYNARR